MLSSWPERANDLATACVTVERARERSVRIAERLEALGIELPPVSPPVNPTSGTKRVGNLVYVSARAPKMGGVQQLTGKVGRDLDEDMGAQAARVAVLNALATLSEGIGGLDRVRQIVKLTGYVNSAPGFTNQHIVMNGATALLLEVFGARGRHARGSIGVAELPLNNSVEVELIVEVEDGWGPAIEHEAD